VTAEVALLNKLGIALAADSAVTISEGSDSRKVFNTADKLFELSRSQPIACMVFSNLQFVQGPLQVLIKEFRAQCATYASVADASAALLDYLHAFAVKASNEIKQASIAQNARAIYDILVGRVNQHIERRLSDEQFFTGADNPAEKIRETFSEAWDLAIGVLERFSEGWADAEFIGEYPPDDALKALFANVLDTVDQKPPEEKRDRVAALMCALLKKASPLESSTGIVVAGYGSDELFPTLDHFELYAPVMGALKFLRVERVDIARRGPRARVMAFAQREMAERFLFGLDAQTKEKILHFSRSAIASIGDHAASLIEFGSDDEAKAFRESVFSAEQAFVAGLESQGMETIRSESQSAVEDMVEFMPKQDLADFAEALVNLSSLQRRVHSGFETVGGPIDVAVISKSEGMVWVKRKHYFPRELNAHFFNRIGGEA
jgi:hypothetical protein